MTLLGKVLSVREAHEVNLAELAGAMQAGMSSPIPSDDELTFEGYEVRTDLHAYQVLVQDVPQCCEGWGYVVCNDDLAAFVGAQRARRKSRARGASPYPKRGG